MNLKSNSTMIITRRSAPNPWFIFTGLSKSKRKTRGDQMKFKYQLKGSTMDFAWLFYATSWCDRCTVTSVTHPLELSMSMENHYLYSALNVQTSKNNALERHHLITCFLLMLKWRLPENGQLLKAEILPNSTIFIKALHGPKDLITVFYHYFDICYQLHILHICKDLITVFYHYFDTWYQLHILGHPPFPVDIILRAPKWENERSYGFTVSTSHK